MKNIKESAALIVAMLLEDEDAKGYFEYQVYPTEERSMKGEATYNIQVPTPAGIYVNHVFVPEPLDDAGIKLIEKRMAELAAQRDYPTGSFFVAPWATYLIHGKTIGKVF